MIGKRVAHFEITGKLGEGGMGVVYEAMDGRLNRRVALKVLPPEMVANQTRKLRFIQEAKAASALNHPNIVTVYEIGSADGSDYIAMELVAGQTLENLLSKRIPKVAETLKYAIQIADALAVAHSAGIVHRDLKPANVMITDSGLVKVLDFGLAKLNDATEGTEADTTRTRFDLTIEGSVVGTAAYMSPEQAEGRNVDARSDIFSFGLVVYEMLGGKRAFTGPSRMATLAAIITQEPGPLSEIVLDLPAELERIVARCLRKDLARRSQSIAEVKVALEDLKEERESTASASKASKSKRAANRWRWIAAPAAALAIGTAVFLLLPQFRQTQTPLKEVPLTSYEGYQGEPTLSPDGNQFAFVWDGGQEKTPPQLYVGLAGQGTPLKLTNTPGVAARLPAWSPDGQKIAFLRPTPGQFTGSLTVIPALGGPELRVGEAWSLSRPAWSPDGKWLYFSTLVSLPTRAMFASPSGGGERHRLTDPPAGANGDESPAVSPDGRKLVFVRAVSTWNQDLYVADLRDGKTAGVPRQLTSDQRNKYSPVWTTNGEEIVYVAGEATSSLAIYRVRASGGEPMRVGGIGDYAVALAIAPKGHRLVYSRSFQDYNIWRMPLPAAGNSTGAERKFLSSTRFEASPAFSPDGNRIAFTSNRRGVRQIWVSDADGSNPAPLTNFTEGVAGSPQWSPDGLTIVFDARPKGLADVYSIPTAGGLPKRLTDNPAEDHVPSFSADGRWIYFASTRSGQRQLYRMPANGGDAVQITQKGAYVPLASSDGQWIYYSKPNGAIWKVPAPGGEETAVLEAGSIYNAFAICVAASGIYFASAPDPASRAVALKLYRFADGKIVELARFDKPLSLHVSISPDEKWLLYTRLDSSVDELMLVDDFR